MSHNSTLPQTAPSLQDVSRYVPTYKQKVDAYMRIDKNTSAPSTGQGSSHTYGSVLDATLREENESSPCQPLDSIYEVTADHRATHFDTNRMHKRNMRLSLFHLLMSRCQTLQCIVNASECKPQTQKLTLDINTNYSRILSFAQEARRIAEELESVALEARSEYWAGRGCGGLRDWQAATKHFTNAIRLDTSYGTLNYTKCHYEGLLLHEKEDVEFLLQNAKKCHNEWTLRTKKIKKKQDGHETEGANSEDLKGPSWTPNRDFRNWAAKQQLEKSKKSGRRTNVFLPEEGQKVRKLWKHEIPMIRRRLAMSDDRDSVRRTLNAGEWFYILRGNSISEDHNTSTIDQGETEKEDSGGEKDSITPALTSPHTCSLDQSPLEGSRNLDEELQQSGYLETRPPSAGSLERMTHPDDDEDLLQSLASASPHDPMNVQTMLFHTDSSEQEPDWSSPVMSPLSETGFNSTMDCEVKDNSVEVTE